MLSADEVMQMYEGWKSALMNNNIKALGVICDVNFVWTNAAGEQCFKDDLLRESGSDNIVYETWTSQEHRVRFYGNTAVLTCRDRLNLVQDGEARDMDQRAMAVFFRQENGAWKLVACQLTDIAADAGGGA